MQIAQKLNKYIYFLKWLKQRNAEKMCQWGLNLFEKRTQNDWKGTEHCQEGRSSLPPSNLEVTHSRYILCQNLLMSEGADHTVENWANHSSGHPLIRHTLIDLKIVLNTHMDKHIRYIQIHVHVSDSLQNCVFNHGVSTSSTSEIYTGQLYCHC